MSDENWSSDYPMCGLPQIMEEIEKCLEERYVIPLDVEPWRQKYWTDNKYSSPTCIYNEGIVPTRVRMYRTMWLVNEAHSVLIERLYQLAMVGIQPGCATPWAVFSAAIATGTQEAMLNNDKGSLWRQRGLLGKNLGVVGNYPNASERTMRQQLEDYTTVADKDRLYEKVRQIEGDPQSQWLYFLTPHGRLSFCRLVMLRRGLWIARAVKDRTSVAEKLKEQWIDRFDHPYSIIEAILDNHNWPDTLHMRDDFREENRLELVQ